MLRIQARSGFALVAALFVLSAVALLVVLVTRLGSQQADHAQQAWTQEMARRQAQVAFDRARERVELLLGPDSRTTRRAATGEIEVWRMGSEPQPLGFLSTEAATAERMALPGGAEAPLVELRNAEGTLLGRCAYWVDDEGLKANLARLGPPQATPMATPAERYRGRRRFRADGWPEGSGDFSPEGLDDLDLEPAQRSDFTVWSKGVLADVQGGGLRQNWSSLAAPEAVRAYVANAPAAWDADRRVLSAGAGPGQPGPLLTEAELRAGVYAFRYQGHISLNLRYYVQAELWNPYPWPLVFPDADDAAGYEQAMRLVWQQLPRVRVRSYRPNGTGWTLRDDTGWQSLDDLQREGYPPERNVASWLEVAGLRLEPGELYRAFEPALERQPEGLARRLSDDFRLDPARDRLVVELSGGDYALHLLPYTDPPPSEGYATEAAYAHQRQISTASRSWTFEPPLSVAREDRPAVFLLASDLFRPEHCYWGLHWRADEAALVKGTRAFARDGEKAGESLPVDFALPLTPEARAGGYWQSPEWRSHPEGATQATWLDWPLVPPQTLGELRSLADYEALGQAGGPNAAYDFAFFAADRAGLVPWPVDTVLPEPDDPEAAAKALRVGAFNVNSTSYAAWRALLSAGFVRLPGSDAAAYASTEGEPRDAVGLARVASVAAGPDLSDDQLDQLAALLAQGNRERTQPWASLQEMVDRGWLQQCLEAVQPLYTEAQRLQDVPATGLPGVVDQADVLARLEPVLAARSDTFRVLFYGEALHPRSGEVVGRAWGEAILQRTPELRADGQGRAFAVRAFRWLRPPSVRD
ncbi:MAG: hypothetical protein E1N59_1658 [Puniceicoccaceae bacterium 5H]|nr:MAG: hypothetical protein E1N59_1658 [Puniceicoccaceae bacterium 5H]